MVVLNVAMELPDKVCDDAILAALLAVAVVPAAAAAFLQATVVGRAARPAISASLQLKPFPDEAPKRKEKRCKDASLPVPIERAHRCLASAWACAADWAATPRRRRSTAAAPAARSARAADHRRASAPHRAALRHRRRARRHKQTTRAPRPWPWPPAAREERLLQRVQRRPTARNLQHEPDELLLVRRPARGGGPTPAGPSLRPRGPPLSNGGLRRRQRGRCGPPCELRRALEPRWLRTIFWDSGYGPASGTPARAR